MRQTLVMILLAGAFVANAQSITYRHDDTKQNQVTVAETGVGNLTPTLYYDVLHRSYSRTAAEQNKLNYRSQGAAAALLQIDDAEKLDSAMVKRAEVETLNMADRMGGAADLAWLAEKDKITKAMTALQQNIGRILSAGGSSDHYTLWSDRLRRYAIAVYAMQQAYMPNSERKTQYLKIHAELVEANETLLRFLVRLQGNCRVRQLFSASYTKSTDNGRHATAALARWKSTTNNKSTK